MTAVEILAGLQAAGVAVRVDGDNLLCRPRAAVPAPLLDEVARLKPEIIALIREAPPTTCPDCNQLDYMPLGGNWRRCWVCGRRWGPAGSLDPGDPADPKEMARLLRLSAWPGTTQVAERAHRDAGEAPAGRRGDAQISHQTGGFEYEGDAGDAQIPSCSKSAPTRPGSFASGTGAVAWDGSGARTRGCGAAGRAVDRCRTCGSRGRERVRDGDLHHHTRERGQSPLDGS